MALTHLETHIDLSPASPKAITDSFTINCTDTSARYKINADIPHAFLVRTAADITIQNASGTAITKDDDFFLKQSKRDAYYSTAYSLSSIFSEIQFVEVGVYTVTRHLCVGTYINASYLNAIKTQIKEWLTTVIPGILDSITQLTETVTGLAERITNHDTTLADHETRITAASAHADLTSAHGATSEATADAIMSRDADGCTKVATATDNSHAVNKGQMDTALAQVAAAAGGGSVNSLSTTNTVNHFVTYQNEAGTIIQDSGYAGATDATASTVAIRDANADITARKVISTIATGTAPLTVTSTTVVTNLNADMVDGRHVAESANASTVVSRDGSADINARRFISDIGTGTSPFVVNSSTVVPNLTAENSVHQSFPSILEGAYTFDGIAGAFLGKFGSSAVWSKGINGGWARTGDKPFVISRIYYDGAKVWMCTITGAGTNLTTELSGTASYNWSISY